MNTFRGVFFEDLNMCDIFTAIGTGLLTAIGAGTGAATAVGVGATALAGAGLGMGTAAISGGNIWKGALFGGIGGVAGAGIGSSLGGLAGGATATAIGAGTGGVAGGIGGGLMSSMMDRTKAQRNAASLAQQEALKKLESNTQGIQTVQKTATALKDRNLNQRTLSSLRVGLNTGGDSATGLNIPT